MNCAHVFTALLGSIDEVAKGFMVRRLQPELSIAIDGADRREGVCQRQGLSAAAHLNCSVCVWVSWLTPSRRL